MAARLHGHVPPGTTIGHWTVIAEAPRRWGLRHLLCRCTCGTERAVFIGALRIGTSTSCGCQIGIRSRTHGMSATPEYTLWRAINQRCHNPKSTAYPNYGGRGIRVCDRWQESFENFFADIGQRPSPELTFDRINNNGNYEPGNVRWADRVTQNSNTRWTHEDRVRHGRRNAMRRWHPDHIHEP
jgi:hypothetical protein